MDQEKPKEWRREGVELYLPIFTILFILSNTSYQLYRFHSDFEVVSVSLSTTFFTFFCISLHEHQMMLLWRHVDPATCRRYMAAALIFGSGIIAASSWTLSLAFPFAASLVLWLIVGLSVAGALYGHAIYAVEDVILPWRSLMDLPLLLRAATWVFPVLCFICYSSAMILYFVGRLFY
ncbi:hypothetical protein QJS04_geneDACA016919 [Acorus gramineus]|uniref:Uncharacterized protein n=1 Tax=Acorus gramineus TaxID=55184 RepID=A0AAV9BR85_ACOGR|nr:hypothetical protein QJS04_geneDACA016919 [Acorus gramineus]